MNGKRPKKFKQLCYSGQGELSALDVEGRVWVLADRGAGIWIEIPTDTRGPKKPEEKVEP